MPANVIMLNPEVAARQISAVIEDWLHEEVLTSGADHNSYLDDLATERAHLVRSADDPENHHLVKVRGHYDRQRAWGAALLAEPANEYVAARQTFNPLMRMSGAFRRMCYLEAVDQADYERLRTAPCSTGIDTRAIVASRLLLRSLESSETEAAVAAPDAKEVHAETLAAFQTTFEDLAYVAQHAPSDLGQTESPSVTRLRTTQELWCGVVTDSILMAAGYRQGDLAAVPFLEPKSISHEHQIQYPFRQPA